MPRRTLLVGGAPEVPIDAVRFLTVDATGATAVALAERLAAAGCAADLLLSRLAAPQRAAARYRTRADLEAALEAWLAAHPGGTVVMSAAINDYRLHAVEAMQAGAATVLAPGAKAASGADELVIRLRPAAKLIDSLRARGHRGPLVAFKYEAAATVLASAERLRQRTAAALVVANSLCGTVQAILAGDGAVTRHPSRAPLIDDLAARLVALAG